MIMWILRIETLLKAGYYFVNGADCTNESVSGKPTKENPYFKGVFKYGNHGVVHPDIAQRANYKFNYNFKITLLDGTESVGAVLNKDGTKCISYSFPCNKIDKFDLKRLQSICAYR